MRIGNGFDVHRLIEGRLLVLGGVTIAHDRGLEGHSDGDSLTHAIVDALLGAAALGDIGMHFPPEDPRFKNADSTDFLRHTSSLVQARGYKIVNIDSTVMCERPKLSPYFQAIRESIAKALNLDIDQVSVKAKTSEKLGYIGREEAIAAEAVALIDAV